MNLSDSVRAVTEASGDGPIDWHAVTDAAKSATEPGDLSLSETTRAGYASDVRDARTRIQEVADVEFDLPDAIEVQNRHHWIDANVRTFERVMGVLETQDAMSNVVPGVSGIARVLNTGSMTVALSFLASNVLGQYDPLLLADSPTEDHALYFVHPNIAQVADELDAAEERFRRWIAFHEVTHAAEFGAAPWLSGYLEDQMERSVEALNNRRIDREAFREVDAAMTAVEGYAELLMDRAFDDEYDDLRRKVDARRGGKGLVSQIVRRLLGMGMKQRQYERGKAFFEHVVDARSIEGASVVWDRPENLPSDAELDSPEKWLARVH